MKNIYFLENKIQPYAWGSYTEIPKLLGIQPDFKTPLAELWMGTHPKDPSMIKQGGKSFSLTDLISQNPEKILGKKAAQNFNNQLPYLFKVLAIRKPLSIQVHPDMLQAKQGFEKEQNLKIPLDAGHRKYKDPNHKPECICALTDFWALKGFRGIDEITLFLEKACPLSLKQDIEKLKNNSDNGLKNFFSSFMRYENAKKEEIVSEALKNAAALKGTATEFEWIIRLNNEYPSDIAVISPLILNLVRLKPGQALFLNARELHAYLKGVGVEIMANSDNVLRCGLTPKYIDVDELLRIVNFQESETKFVEPVQKTDSEKIYAAPAEEFELSAISVNNKQVYTALQRKSIEIILCAKGKANITFNKKTYCILQGQSFAVPTKIEQYTIKGNALLYKAGIP